MLEQPSGYYVSGARCRFLTWIPGFNCLGFGHFTPLPAGIRVAEHSTREALWFESFQAGRRGCNAMTGLSHLSGAVEKSEELGLQEMVFVFK